jgi:hypothetical protein
MHKNKFLNKFIVLLLLCGFLAACASGPSSSGGGGGSAASSRPVWVNRPDTLFSSDQYVVAIGDGKTAEEAQFKARANLLGIFGMRLADESVIAEMFQQTTTGGGTSWSDTVTSDRRISTSAEGILSGCEIKETWVNPAGTEHYALAVMEKARTISIYTDIIARLTQAINEIINVANRNTIDGYSSYIFAASIAKDIDACVNVLRFVGGSGSVPAGLKSENEYMVDARNILREIPVNVVLVSGREFDTAGRIHGAFAKAIGDAGFRTGAANSPYVLEVTLSLAEVVNPNPQNNIFVRYEISANLIQVSTRQGVVPAYNINNREGHRTKSEAENRAIMSAERRISEEYVDMLIEHLSQLIVGRR